jgi:hypothetical protein
VALQTSTVENVVAFLNGAVRTALPSVHRARCLSLPVPPRQVLETLIFAETWASRAEIGSVSSLVWTPSIS